MPHAHPPPPELRRGIAPRGGPLRTPEKGKKSGAVPRQSGTAAGTAPPPTQLGGALPKSAQRPSSTAALGPGVQILLCGIKGRQTNLTVSKLLGKGSFGSVWEVVKSADGDGASGGNGSKRSSVGENTSFALNRVVH